VLVYEISNTTGDMAKTAVPLSFIPVGSTIHAVSIMHRTTNTENIFGLWDVVRDKDGNLMETIAESETASGEAGYYPFFHTITIQTQLTVHQGSQTDVLIYYSR